MKIKRIITFGLCCVLCLSFFACGKEKNDENNGKVLIEKSLLNEYAHENIFTTSYTDKGIKMEGIQNLKSICSKMRFPITEQNPLSVTFCCPVYEEDSEDFVITDTNVHTKTCVDVMVIGQTKEMPVVQLRLWGDKTVGAKSINARIAYGVNEQSYPYNESFGETGLPYADIGLVKGNFRESESFTFTFDKENLFMGYKPDGAELQRLLDETNAEQKLIADNIRTLFANIESVSLVIRFSGLLYEDLPSYGYNGFESASCIYISDICGQSLKSADGYVVDDVKPYVSAPKIVEDKDIAAYTDYSYEVKMNEELDAARNTVFYSSFATDVLSWEDLTYKVHLTMPDGSVVVSDGLNFSTKEAGTYKIKIETIDSSNNSYVSEETEFVVKDSYRINLNGTIPETAKKGDTLAIPTAYVTDADGNRNDELYVVSVVIKDPLEMEVVATNGKITFNRKGIYTIKYSSSYNGEKDTKEFKIKVS